MFQWISLYFCHYCYCFYCSLLQVLLCLLLLPFLLLLLMFCHCCFISRCSSSFGCRSFSSFCILPLCLVYVSLQRCSTSRPFVLKQHQRYQHVAQVCSVAAGKRPQRPSCLRDISVSPDREDGTIKSREKIKKQQELLVLSRYRLPICNGATHLIGWDKWQLIGSVWQHKMTSESCTSCTTTVQWIYFICSTTVLYCHIQAVLGSRV